MEREQGFEDCLTGRINRLWRLVCNAVGDGGRRMVSLLLSGATGETMVAFTIWGHLKKNRFEAGKIRFILDTLGSACSSLSP